MHKSRLILGATVLLSLSLAGCGDGNDKTYDISPIFPLSADKCAKYNGEPEGEGLFAKCWVTLDDCQKAAADWAEAMKNLPDAILFRCTAGK